MVTELRPLKTFFNNLMLQTVTTRWVLSAKSPLGLIPFVEKRQRKID